MLALLSINPSSPILDYTMSFQQSTEKRLNVLTWFLCGETTTSQLEAGDGKAVIPSALLKEKLIGLQQQKRNGK